MPNFLYQYYLEINQFINNFLVICSIYLLFLVLNILLYYIKDRKYLRIVYSYEDPQEINLKDLNSIPLVNILVPAWKEDELFRDCLISITKLNYPKLKIIVNAGGNDLTHSIADSFKENDNFLILRQTGGKEKAALGKIKAVNECLPHINEGIVYIIDADCYLTDEIILRLVYPITNLNESVVIGAGLRALPSQLSKDFVKFQQFYQFGFFKNKFLRYYEKSILGASTCVTYEVIKAVGQFSEGAKYAEDISRGQDIKAHGFKIFQLTHYRSRIYTDTPTSIYDFFLLKRRSIENSLIYSVEKKSYRYIFRFIVFLILNLILLFLPLLAFLNLGLFFIGTSLFLYLYLEKFRKYIFFRKYAKGKYEFKFGKLFPLKIVIYIYMDVIINVYTLMSIFLRKIQKKN